MTLKTLYLVDISSYIFRAYYAVRPLHASDGTPTNAVYGVCTMIHKLLRDKKPDHLAIVFDSPTPTFRKEIYPQYKANRESPPEDLAPQFGLIKEFVKTYPLPILQKDGFEADDILATIVKQHHEKKIKGVNGDLEVVIVSADKDLMQLVGNGVLMFDSMKDKKIDIPQVLEKFGVRPDQVIDVQSLCGDASDNIPGVKGVGEKTASKLIQQYENLENLYDHLHEIKGKLQEKLQISKDNAFLSKKLVTLKNDTPIDTDWDCFELPKPDQKKLNSFYKKLDLKSLVIHSEDEEVEKTKNKTNAKYDLILDEQNFLKWVDRLQNATGGFAFDTETTGLFPLKTHLVGLSFSDKKGEACYIPLTHSYLGVPDQLDEDFVLEKLKPILENPKILKFAQNAKFDCEVLSQHNITVKGLSGDSMIASYLLNPETPHNMDYLAKEHLQYETVEFKDLVPKNQTIADVDVEKVSFYACEDADITFQLVHKLNALLKEKNSLLKLYEEVEIPLIGVLTRMEIQGALLNISSLKKMGVEFSERLKIIEKEIFNLAGCQFNVNSPKQLQEILFVKLQLQTVKKTKTGHSTDVEVLTVLANKHPLPKFLLEHRTLSKLLSTYVNQLQNLADPKTNRIHTNYNQTIAATGRLSSTDPNLQNIPIRTPEGRRLREVFVAPENYKIVSADYSQIELRLLAAFSKDPVLMKAFQNNEDIHAITAREVFGIKDKAVDAETRAMAKTVNFGILYGQSAFSLAKQLNVSQNQAKEFIDGFYNHYSKVKEYKEKVLEEIRQTGIVQTWKGRIRVVNEINSQNFNVRSNAERLAFNTIFQGSAADLIKVAMINIDKKLAHQSDAKMIMQVHDELIFEVPTAELDTITCLIKNEMENAIACDVPLKVDVGVGDNWGEAH